MTDANLMDARCFHGYIWDECEECNSVGLSNEEKETLLSMIPTEELMRVLINRFDLASRNEEFETSINFLRAATLRNILFGMHPNFEHFRRV